MRLASLSFFLYSLSLVAVTSGQSAFVSDVSDLATSESSAPSATPTSESTSEATTTSSSSSSESETSTTSEDPTSTSSTSESETTPTSTSSSSSSETTTTDEPSSTSATTTSDATTTGPTKTSATTTSKPSTTSQVVVVTTVQTISGTPVPTTMSSTSVNTNAAGEATSAPGLNEDSSSNSDNSGLSESNKKVVIGVVVGVGGAIALGVIGLVFWRLRSKKNRGDSDEAADLMSGTPVGSGTREKAPSPGAAGGTPFRSTLDQYHNPGPVNAASNF
ncbi:putative cell wall protein [Aspergillus ruber CBS 135680]|uniref:Mid2 domain-containing protein n=1 Tax=Aspergillus ruber (strain CBS 135680) TaxID=1388766 RepID=A0A017SC65_ASPRC|nr:uncharacterized protein EURHEDRAFT_412956 [Aspergillus ruber CBS 135680]EYE94613.1 hypothetical protein EURHEDRAFT_412956 [Aspergillus ruber CBS 135680]